MVAPALTCHGGAVSPLRQAVSQGVLLEGQPSQAVPGHVHRVWPPPVSPVGPEHAGVETGPHRVAAGQEGGPRGGAH